MTGQAAAPRKCIPIGLSAFIVVGCLAACSDGPSSGTPAAGGAAGVSGGGSGGAAGSDNGASGGSSGASASGGSGGGAFGGSGGGSSGSSGSGGDNGSTADAGDDGALPSSDASSGPPDSGAPGGGGINPYGIDDPKLVSIFDGQTLNGWIQSAAGGWVAKDGVIHGTGTAGRGYLYTMQDYGSFRWIFSVRHITGNHEACVLFWGTHPPPALDALGALQFELPNGQAWDYRPGHNNGGAAYFPKLPHPTLDHSMWNECEVLADASKGFARLACCTIPTGATHCKGVEERDFNDPTWTNHKAPLALQVHNGGLVDEYRDLYVETDPAPGTLLITQ